jgi:hypothetical protein
MHVNLLLYLVALFSLAALVGTLLYRRRRAKMTLDERRAKEIIPSYRDRIH